MFNFCILFDFSTARVRVGNGEARIEKAPDRIPFLPKDQFNFCPMCGCAVKAEAKVGKSFPYNLRRVRQMRGMTQEALGRALHVQRAAISKYERGRTKPNIKQLTTLCKVLEVSPQELI